MTDVTREDRLVTIAQEAGLRGRDGTSSQLVQITQTNSSPSAIVAAPTGGAPATATNLFMMRVAYAFVSGTLTLDITGVTNGDPRAVKLPNSDAGVPAGSLVVGSWIIVGLRGDGFFEIVAPTVSAGGSGAIVLMEQTARSVNIVTFQPADGHALPNDTGIGVVMMAQLDGAPGGTGWAFAIEGITLDPLQLKYLDGTDVAPGRIGDRAYILWTRNDTTGFYELLDVWDTASAQGSSGSSSGLSEYQTIQAVRTNDSVAVARNAARENIAVQWVT